MELETTEQIGCDLRNRITSTCEVVEFLANRPAKYFAYVSVPRATLETWTGEKLGDISITKVYDAPCFGGYSTRASIRVRAINGEWYSGTYYKSSGDYARIKRTSRKGW